MAAGVGAEGRGGTRRVHLALHPLSPPSYSFLIESWNLDVGNDQRQNSDDQQVIDAGEQALPFVLEKESALY